MSRITAIGPASATEARQNHLLANLDGESLAETIAAARHVRMAPRTPLYEPGERIEHVYFPLGGLISVVATSRDGSTVEVGPVGCDGMIGLPVYLGGETDPLEAFVQVGTADALRIHSGEFRALVDRLPGLTRVMRLYVQWTYFSMAQWVLCARLHPVEERLGRWLLMSHDRLGADRFPLTHEYLAEMLGVRRASVTIAAGALRAAGFIEYRRGIVTIQDRARLEEASCECNRVTALEYRRLMGRGPEASRPFRPVFGLDGWVGEEAHALAK